MGESRMLMRSSLRGKGQFEFQIALSPFFCAKGKFLAFKYRQIKWLFDYFYIEKLKFSINLKFCRKSFAFFVFMC